jgi:hypothetical protein
MEFILEFLPNTDKVWGSTTALKEKKTTFHFHQHFLEGRLRKQIIPRQEGSNFKDVFANALSSLCGC